MRYNIYWFLICLFGIITYIENNHSKKRYRKTTRKSPTYKKTFYKPRKPENKGLPHGDFTHEHVESMWNELK